METLLEVERMKLEKEGRLAWLTFTREAALNAMDNDATFEINRMALALLEDPDVRVVVIRGRGRAFSTGIDLKEYAAHKIDMTYHERWEEALHASRQWKRSSSRGCTATASAALCSWHSPATFGSAPPTARSGCLPSRNR